MLICRYLFVYVCARLLFVLPTFKGIDPCGVGNEDFFPVVRLLLYQTYQSTRRYCAMYGRSVLDYLLFMALCMCVDSREERSITFYGSGDRSVCWPGFIVFHFRSYCRVCRCGVLGFLRNFRFLIDGTRRVTRTT